jgi:MoaA/NifB/PqqE/SkfB family radical SAM enzyme
MSWFKKKPALRTLVIKPTLKCTANCFGCANRRELHRSLFKERKLEFEDWQRILADAASLGLRGLGISGGEPTLHKDILKLVAEGRKRCSIVNMNTNGSRITQSFAEELLEAGLTSVMISLYSHDPEVHDGFRRSRNLWQKAVEAIRIFAKLRDDKYPDFCLRTQFVMLRENFRSLDKLVEFHHELGSDRVHVCYLEGDFERKYLLKAQEIDELRQEVVPKLLDTIAKLELPDREEAEAAARGLYGEEAGKPEDLEQGVYWRGKPCGRPKHFALLLADGQVHPCNIVEYTHHPVMGNLFESDLGEIFHSREWKAFRRHRFDKCALCPMHLHTGFNLR